MKVVVIRHSIRNDTGETDCSITNEGIKLIDNKIIELSTLVDFDNVTIITSPFKRTIETSQCIAKHASPDTNIIMDRLLHETFLSKQMMEKLPKILLEYCGTKYETWSDIKERCSKFLNKIQGSKIKTDIIAITHGGIVNSILSIVDPSYKFEQKYITADKYVPGYCGYIVIELDENTRKWSVIKKNFGI